MGVPSQWIVQECEGIYTTKIDPKGRITIALPMVKDLADRTYNTLRDCEEIVIDDLGILYQGKRICRINTPALQARIRKYKGPITDSSGKQSVLDEGLVDYQALSRDLIIKTYRTEKRDRVRTFGTLDARINRYLHTEEPEPKYIAVEGYTMDEMHRLVLNRNNEIRKKAEQTESREIIMIGKGNFYVIGAETEREFLSGLQLV